MKKSTQWLLLVVAGVVAYWYWQKTKAASLGKAAANNSPSAGAGTAAGLPAASILQKLFGGGRVGKPIQSYKAGIGGSESELPSAGLVLDVNKLLGVLWDGAKGVYNYVSHLISGNEPIFSNDTSAHDSFPKITADDLRSATGADSFPPSPFTDGSGYGDTGYSGDGSNYGGSSTGYGDVGGGFIGGGDVGSGGNTGNGGDTGSGGDTGGGDFSGGDTGGGDFGGDFGDTGGESVQAPPTLTPFQRLPPEIQQQWLNLSPDPRPNVDVYNNMPKNLQDAFLADVTANPGYGLSQYLWGLDLDGWTNDGSGSASGQLLGISVGGGPGGYNNNGKGGTGDAGPKLH